MGSFIPSHLIKLKSHVRNSQMCSAVPRAACSFFKRSCTVPRAQGSYGQSALLCTNLHLWFVFHIVSCRSQLGKHAGFDGNAEVLFC